jgi:hypothetical protein
MDDKQTCVLTNLPCPSNERFLNECDAVLITTSHSYEEVSLTQMKSWFKSFRQDPLPVYAVGPILPPGYGRHATDSSESEKSQDVRVFLEEMQTKHGERSVVFVGFFPLYHWANGQIFIIIFSDLFWDGLLAYGAGIHR